MRRLSRSWAIAAGVGLIVLVAGSGCDSMRSTRRTDPAAGLDSLRTVERFQGTPEAVAEACREAMVDLGITDEALARAKRGGRRRRNDQPAEDANVAQTSLGNGGQSLRGTTSDGRPVSMDLRPSGAMTAVSVRVGRDGDVSYAHAFLERVGIRMGVKPPSPIDDPPSPPPASAAYPILSKEAVPNSTILRDQVRSTYQDSPVPY